MWSKYHQILVCLWINAIILTIQSECYKWISRPYIISRPRRRTPCQELGRASQPKGHTSLDIALHPSDLSCCPPCLCGRCTSLQLSLAAMRLILASTQQFNCDSRSNNKHTWLPACVTLRGSSAAGLYVQTHGAQYYSHFSLYTRTPRWMGQWGSSAPEISLEPCSSPTRTGRSLPLVNCLSGAWPFLKSSALTPAQPPGIQGAGVWSSVWSMVGSIPSRLLSALDNQRMKHTSWCWGWQQIYMAVVPSSQVKAHQDLWNSLMVTYL